MQLVSMQLILLRLILMRLIPLLTRCKGLLDVAGGVRHPGAVAEDVGQCAAARAGAAGVLRVFRCLIECVRACVRVCVI